MSVKGGLVVAWLFVENDNNGGKTARQSNSNHLFYLFEHFVGVVGRYSISAMIVEIVTSMEFFFFFWFNKKREMKAIQIKIT